MIVGSGLPASDFSEKSSAFSRTPSLMMFAVRKSILSGALNPVAGCCGAAAGSGGRVVEGCCAYKAPPVARIVTIKTSILFRDCVIIIRSAFFLRRRGRRDELLKLAATACKHQLDQLFGDFRLEPFGVALIKAYDVGDYAALLAVRIGEYLRLAGRGQEPPTRAQQIQTSAVKDVAGLDVFDLPRGEPRAARIFLGPFGGLGHALLVNFALACRVDVREVGGGRLPQRRHSRRHRAGSAGSCGPGCARRSAAGGSESRAATRVPTQTTAGEAEPSVHPVLEEIRTHEPVGGHAALGMAHQPESLDVLLADLLDDEVDDVLQVLVVGVSPHPRRRVRSGDDQTILVHIIQQREIMALPVPVRAGAVQAQNEGDLLALLQVARIIEEVGAARLHFDHVPLVDHCGARALTVGAVQIWSAGGAGRALKLEGFFLGARRSSE